MDSQELPFRLFCLVPGGREDLSDWAFEFVKGLSHLAPPWLGNLYVEFSEIDLEGDTPVRIDWDVSYRDRIATATFYPCFFQAEKFFQREAFVYGFAHMCCVGQQETVGRLLESIRAFVPPNVLSMLQAEYADAADRDTADLLSLIMNMGEKLALSEATCNMLAKQFDEDGDEPDFGESFSAGTGT